MTAELGAATPRWYPHIRDRAYRCAPPAPQALEFHQGLAEYVVTPLVDLPPLAAELGVGQVVAKDESLRLGLPAFKALGASWALHRALRELGDATPSRAAGPLTVITATDGNHGRAVAKFARLAGHRASIFIPTGVSAEAIDAVRREGAEVSLINGSYDEAVAAAADAAQADGALLIQDTAWAGYEEIPGWIVEGYATLFAEADRQAAAINAAPIDCVVVPVGVGSLLQAALAHYRSRRHDEVQPAVVSVEPVVASCLAPSLAAGHPVTVETGETILAGLNCGTPSSLAWPLISAGLDAAVSVTDAEAAQAARDLAALGVPAGPCGGAGLAALRQVLTGAGAAERRQHLGISPQSTVAFVVTEGSAANPVPQA